MERAFGADFSDVRLHGGAESEALNDTMGAAAFTVGRHVFLGGDTPPLDQPTGQRLLAHELTHTIQQGAAGRRSGVDRPTRQSTQSAGRAEHLSASSSLSSRAPVQRLVRDGNRQLSTKGVIEELQQRYPNNVALIKFKTVDPYVKKPEEMSLADVATAMNLGSTQVAVKPLADRVKDILGKVPAELTAVAAFGQIKILADEAQQADRDVVYANKALLASAKTKLGAKDYIGMLGALRVVESSSTGSLGEGPEKRHTSSGVADALIRGKYGDYAAEAIKAGKKISGQIAILSDADFRTAYLQEYGPTDHDVDTTNAFVRVSSDRMVIVHSDRGNAGTPIHEGIHKYSDLTIKNRWGFQFNEAITEYITRELTDNLTPPIVRGNYASNLVFGRKLVALVGADVVKQAYFNGKIDFLLEMYARKANRPKSDLDLAADALSTSAWNTALAYLDKVP